MASVRPRPEPGEVWRHFKGNEYIVVCVAKSMFNPVRGSMYVVYRTRREYYMRPLSEWNEKVLWNGKRVWRFEKVDTEGAGTS